MSSTDSTIDPNEVDDFPWDWSARLGAGETITAATVTIAEGAATVDGSSTTGAVVTARLSGASGSVVKVLCRVTTSLGRTLDDTWPLIVANH